MGQRPFRDVRTSPQWSATEGKFVNKVDTRTGADGITKILPRYMRRAKGAGQPAKPIPVRRLKRQDWPASPDTGLAFTWLGHAAYMIEMEGKFILVDPMLGPRPSPIYAVGPSRLHPVPAEPQDLPVADIVVLSHDHYDHLDKRTVSALAETARLFVVPIGVGPIVHKFGVPIEKIREMDWHESLSVDDIQITALPARHFSGRTLKRDRTLWASYAFKGSRHTFYFGGDSGEQDETYANIGKEHGPFEALIIPIGAYDPLWHDIHLNPEEALSGYHKMGGGLFIPCHWGTFDLALHGWANPPLRLEKAAGKDTDLCWPKVGERFTLAAPPRDTWWKPLVNEVNMSAEE